VDPPYGGGFADNGGCKGWFSKYHQESGGGYYNRFGGRFDKYKHAEASGMESTSTTAKPKKSYRGM